MITFNRNRKSRNQPSKERQRGVALVAALLTLVLITAITAGMIVLSTTETAISANFRDEQTGFFAAKAGMEEIRDRMDSASPNTLRGAANLVPTSLPGTPNSVLYILNPNPATGEVVAPWNGSGAGVTSVNKPPYPDDEICQETTTIPCQANALIPNQLLPSGAAWYVSPAPTASAAYVPAQGSVFPWKWVRVTLKQNNSITQYATNGNAATGQLVCWNGLNEYAGPAVPIPAQSNLGCNGADLPVYVLTAMAVTPTGTRRIIQTEIAQNQFQFNFPAALTLDGGSQNDSFSGGSSNNWQTNGNDSAGCGIAAVGGPVHAIGVGDNQDVTNVDNGIKRPNNITGIGASPDVANVSGSLPPYMQSVSAVEQMISTMKANVTQPILNCTPTACGGLSNPGTVGQPQTIYVNGDLSISGNMVGYGILVVTGNLTVSGTPQWNGIILVVGKGNFTTSGTASYNGAVLVANTVDALGNPLANFGPATVNVNGGGGHGGFFYSSGCVAKNSNLSTFHVMAIRELMR